jgi:hypothetical protein
MSDDEKAAAEPDRPYRPTPPVNYELVPAQVENVAQFLWSLLDDIDTASRDFVRPVPRLAELRATRLVSVAYTPPHETAAT